jgi:hypothetical protein
MALLQFRRRKCTEWNNWTGSCTLNPLNSQILRISYVLISPHNLFFSLSFSYLLLIFYLLSYSPFSFIPFPYYYVRISSFFPCQFLCFYLVCYPTPFYAIFSYFLAVSLLSTFQFVILLTSFSDPGQEPVGSASFCRIRTPSLPIRMRERILHF